MEPIKPIKVCPMCGRLFFKNHGSRIYCRECAKKRDKECKLKWAREHRNEVRKAARNYRARHLEPVPTNGYAWDLIFGYIEDESFERGVYDGLIFEEDKTYASQYAERHKNE